TPSVRDAKAVQISMRWKFVLKHVTGETVTEIDETSVGPQEIVRSDLANNAVMLLINGIFERIGAELAKQDLSGKPAAPAASAEPDAGPPVDAGPPQVCVPGATQECIGAGACKGGQSCLPDGSGFTDCDCGKKKKKSGSTGGGAAPAPAPAPAAPPEPAP
ncbi:MAG TPA: hypothetical protein VGP93_19555, partial [Polyangiaceae bacterium]|nr:hypothetical protein [Polyangiaceae bacterium]